MDRRMNEILRRVIILTHLCVIIINRAIQNKDWRRLRRLINDIVAYYWRQNSRTSSRLRP
jgi:hypothetical protein